MKLKINHPPLTLEQARVLCDKSQHLIGLPLNPQMHAHGRIEHVVVAPVADHAQQKQYVESLVNGGRMDIESYNPTVDYTVLVVGRPLRWVQQSILILDVRSYWRMMESRLKYRRGHRTPAVAV
jgi:hypothetical protein